MEEYPLVHIVILNYNSINDTISCLKSLKNIDYPNYKIVVVDNNSSDNSVEILQEQFKEDIIIANKENMGYASGNNVGIKFALDNGADYICVLNNDVEVEPNFLNPIINLLEEDKSIAIAGPCICEFSDREKVQAMGAYINLYIGLAQGKYRGKNYNSLSKNMFEVDYIGGACFVVRREILENIGLIPENYFLFYEETEFCLKIKKRGYKLICLKNSRVYHKGSATISKFGGLSYYFLNRNRIVFMRRNANIMQKSIFSIYLLAESLGRIILRREPFKLFKYYYEGLKADINNIDIKRIHDFIK